MLMLFLASFLGSCGEDVPDLMEPGKSRIITDIYLETMSEKSARMVETIEIPELKELNLRLVKEYNNGDRWVMTPADIKSNILWQIGGDSSVSLLQASEAPGVVKFRGQGRVSVRAAHRAVPQSGNRPIISNPLSLTVNHSELRHLEIKAEDNRSPGCERSILNSTRVAEGCLLQYQAVAHFDNDTTADVTDWEETSWISLNRDKAKFVTSEDISSDISYEWVDLIFSYIEENSLSSKKGLLLGISRGNFIPMVELQGIQAMGASSFVVQSALHDIDVNIMLYVNAEDEEVYCDAGSVCRLFENTEVNLLAYGSYTNNVRKEITRLCNWSSTKPDTIRIDAVSGVTILSYLSDGESPDAVITAKKDDIEQDVAVTINRELLVGIERYRPAAIDVTYVSNQKIPFIVKGEYNNDIYVVADDPARQTTLNRDVLSWSSSDPAVALIDDGSGDTIWNDYTLEGVIVETASAPSGSASTITASNHLGSIEWTVSIDNENSEPISLSISPSVDDKQSEWYRTYSVEAGIPVQFSALAIFNNNTNRVLNSDEVLWTSDPLTCDINGTERPCITGDGIAESYEDIRIIVQTLGTPNDISTDIQLLVIPTALSAVRITPEAKMIFEKTDLQYAVFGLFENRKTLLLNPGCLDWNLAQSPPGTAVINSSGYLSTYDSAESITVSGTTLENCGAASPPTSTVVPAGITDNTVLSIESLPKVAFETASLQVSESAGTATLTVVSDKPFENDISIAFDASPDPGASADMDLPADYFTIPAGSTKGSLDLLILDDLRDEPDKSVQMVLKARGTINAEPADVSTDLVITILDDDPAPDLFTDGSRDLFEDSETGSIVFHLSEISEKAVTVEYSVSGTAGPDDHSLKDGMLTIPPGNQWEELLFSITDDDRKEGEETIEVRIVSADNAVKSPSSESVITLVDNDSLAISGIPATACMTSACPDYSFKPDVNSDQGLTFTGYNIPGWLSLDLNTGELKGISTPEAGKTYADIALCVEDPEESDCLPLFSITVTEDNE